MKAISLWQPWASLWCSPRKRHETRHWKTPHRGWIAVHAAKIDICNALEKCVDNMADLRQIQEICIDEYGGHWIQDLPRGHIVGVVRLIDVIPTELVKRAPASPAEFEDELLGNFAPGRYAWLRTDFKLLERPIPYKGRQNIFDVPDEMFADLSLEG